MTADDATTDIGHTANLDRSRVWIAVLLLVAGAGWVVLTARQRSMDGPSGSLLTAESLFPGTLASMDSPALAYDQGWTVNDQGADPAEPSQPWLEPSGVFTVTYSGSELALKLSVGDYWGYLYATVDGRPATLLPEIRGNVDSQGESAGYRTFYEPDKAVNGAPQSEWVRIHRASDPAATHNARIEIWRGWGQTPIRGVAIDAYPGRTLPVWPGMALILVGLALLIPAASVATRKTVQSRPLGRLRATLSPLLLPALAPRTRLIAAAALGFGIAVGVGASAWPLTLVGLTGLALLSVGRPALWTAALVFALPFYFSFPMPILPGRAIGLIDAFVLLGVGVAFANWFLTRQFGTVDSTEGGNEAGHAHEGRLESLFSGRASPVMAILLALIIGWAMVSVTAAARTDVALREWRTVFLSAGLFAILLWSSLRSRQSQQSDLWLVATAWIAGGVFVAVAGIFQYVSGSMVIAAEGVHRIRAFYGSPNNLALYLERTFLVSLALGALMPFGKPRVAFAAAAAVQALALVLTFSKGAIVLGVPAGIAVLWIGGLFLLPKQGRSRRPLLWLGAAAVVIVLVLAPFLGTERFRGLLDFSQGTGFLRLQLWRSSWRMALDHLLLGVGPDNFLYTYRSTYLLPQAWQEPNLNHPHNWILDWWTHIGLPGLALATALFVVGLAARWRTSVAAAASRPAEAVLSLGFLAAGVGALVHGLIDASFALPDLMISWVLILMAVIALDEENGRTAPER